MSNQNALEDAINIMTEEKAKSILMEMSVELGGYGANKENCYDNIAEVVKRFIEENEASH